MTNPNDGFTAMVYSSKGVLKISGGKDTPVPLPEGDWKLLSYTIDLTGHEAPKKEVKKEEPKKERPLLQALADALESVFDTGPVAMAGPRYSIVSAAASGGYKAVTVRKGETVVMPFGPPYTPTVTSDFFQDGERKQLSLGMSLVGSAGELATNLIVNGARPGKPAFTITDDKDKVVQNGSFEYG